MNIFGVIFTLLITTNGMISLVQAASLPDYENNLRFLKEGYENDNNGLDNSIRRIKISKEEEGVINLFRLIINSRPETFGLNHNNMVKRCLNLGGDCNVAEIIGGGQEGGFNPGKRGFA